MVYITGDIHGQPLNVVRLAEERIKENDTLILLGDVGANYYGNKRDSLTKRTLAEIKGTVLCIHGNHEQRPHNIASYKEKECGVAGWFGMKMSIPIYCLQKTVTSIR